MIAGPAWRLRPLHVLVLLHRWISIGVCLLFALWFASGAVMLFVPFPALDDARWRERAEPLDLGRVTATPAAALAAVRDATSLRLVSAERSPRYVAAGASGPPQIIDAETGHEAPPIDAAAAMRIAERFGRARAKTATLVGHDQWVVHQGFDAERPYYRVSLDDAVRTDLYVSRPTGEVRQETTRRQRALNTVGSVLHWLYFTPLRRNWAAWDAVVWWVSLTGIAGASTGLIAGTVRYLQGRRLRGAGFALYRGWLQWHHILGLFAGGFLLAWIVSGWLSMDHGRLFSTSGATVQERDALRGLPLARVVEGLDAGALALAAQGTASRSAARIDFVGLGGRGHVLARDATSAALRAADGSLQRQFSAAAIAEAAAAAWPGESVTPAILSQSVGFYGRAEGVGADAVALALRSSQRLAFINPRSGEIEALLDASRRRYAWWYYALHTGRLPGSEGHGDLRISLLLAFLAAGCALSLTGVVLAWRHLRGGPR